MAHCSLAIQLQALEPCRHHLDAYKLYCKASLTTIEMFMPSVRRAVGQGAPSSDLRSCLA
jgi:hypothetical protein